MIHMKLINHERYKSLKYEKGVWVKGDIEEVRILPGEYEIMET